MRKNPRKTEDALRCPRKSMTYWTEEKKKASGGAEGGGDLLGLNEHITGLMEQPTHSQPQHRPFYPLKDKWVSACVNNNPTSLKLENLHQMPGIDVRTFPFNGCSIFWQSKQNIVLTLDTCYFVSCFCVVCLGNFKLALIGRMQNKFPVLF